MTLLYGPLTVTPTAGPMGLPTEDMDLLAMDTSTPILPVLISMEDTSGIWLEGARIQRHKVNILLQPIE